MSARKFLSSRSAQGREKSRQLRFEPLEGRRLLAVDFHLLADVNQTPEPIPASIGPIVTIGDTAYFAANDGVSGRELWKSDGTPAGTVRVKDIFPGDKGSNPKYLTEFQGALYFAASDRDDGTKSFANIDVELWRSDGTEAGTYRVKDLVPGVRTSGIGQLMNAGGTLYFSAAAETTGSPLLWKSDGTEVGTEVAPIPNVFYQPSLSLIGSAGNALLFTVNGDLWRSDGTSDGTFELRKFGDDVSSMERPRVLNQTGEITYFAANDGSGFGLWRTDGTVAGTRFVSRVQSNSSSSRLQSTAIIGETIIFAASDPVHGEELWKSDGTFGGTVLLKDVVPGNNPYSPHASRPYGFTNIDGIVYFLAVNNAVFQTELWRTDGTPDGTFLVKRLPEFGGNHQYSILANVGGVLYFSSLADGRSEPWISDGTEAGTVRLKDIYAGIRGSFARSFAELNGNAIFTAEDDVHGEGLWLSDGTEAGTMLLKHILPATAGSNPQQVTGVGDAIFFQANDGVSGGELWVSDGSSAGTRLVKDIRPGPESSHIYQLIDVRGTLFFTASDGATGSELWKSDGTAAGTMLVRDVFAGSDSSNPMSLLNVDGTLYFIADDGESGAELWKSDGTEAGTVRVKDIAPGAMNSGAYKLLNVNGMIYFSADDGTTGRELWQSDGSEAGTVQVKDINTGPGGADASSLVNVGGTIYFSATDGGTNNELWKSDGTADGTVRVKDLTPGSKGSWPRALANVNGELYFSTYDELAGGSLWKSDGSETGTVKTPHIDVRGYPVVGTIGSIGARFFVLAEGFDGASFPPYQGTALWSSDGTEAGTHALIYYSPMSNFVIWNEHLYFTRFIQPRGKELWRTDGTIAGTEFVKDFSDDDPDNFIGWDILKVVGDRLVLTMTTDLYGAELWISDLPAAPLTGDYDGNGRVDGGDFLAWQRGFGGSATPAGSGADGDASGTVDAGDLAIWKEQFGAGGSTTVATAASVVASDAIAPLAAAFAEPFEDFAESPRSEATPTVEPEVRTSKALDDNDLAGLAQRAAREETLRSGDSRRAPLRHDPKASVRSLQRHGLVSLDVAFVSFGLPTPRAGSVIGGESEEPASHRTRESKLDWTTIRDLSLKEIQHAQ